MPIAYKCRFYTEASFCTECESLVRALMLPLNGDDDKCPGACNICVAMKCYDLCADETFSDSELWPHNTYCCDPKYLLSGVQLWLLHTLQRRADAGLL